jgi:CRISPR type IV-associated protein Csf3
MQPLRIDCLLGTAWCPPAFGLHLDGLIGFAAVDEAATLRTDAPDYDTILADLPFARHDSGVWCASIFSLVNFAGQERRYLTQKTDVIKMATLIGSEVVGTAGGSIIDTQRGPFKNGQAYYTVEHAQGLRAWCVGDPERILELLTRINAVGVKTRIGLGTLLPFDETGELWKITEDPTAHERWKRRSAPVALTPDAVPAVGAWHPPYWRGNQRVWRHPVERIDERQAVALQAA